MFTIFHTAIYLGVRKILTHTHTKGRSELPPRIMHFLLLLLLPSVAECMYKSNPVYFLPLRIFVVFVFFQCGLFFVCPFISAHFRTKQKRNKWKLKQTHLFLERARILFITLKLILLLLFGRCPVVSISCYNRDASAKFPCLFRASPPPFAHSYPLLWLSVSLSSPIFLLGFMFFAQSILIHNGRIAAGCFAW